MPSGLMSKEPILAYADHVADHVAVDGNTKSASWWRDQSRLSRFSHAGVPVLFRRPRTASAPHVRNVPSPLPFTSCLSADPGPLVDPPSVVSTISPFSA